LVDRSDIREIALPVSAADRLNGPRAFSADLFTGIKRPAIQADWPANWVDAYGRDAALIWPGRAAPGRRRAYRDRVGVVLDAVSRMCARGARVLDLGARQGNLSIVLAEQGYRVTWNDQRKDLADYVRLKTELAAIEEYLPGNLFDLPLERIGRFDAIVANEGMEHSDGLLAHLAGLLSPGGVIVLPSLNGRYFLNGSGGAGGGAPVQAVSLSPDQWVVLAARAGLRLMQLDFFTNPLSSGHLKTDHLLPFLPARWVNGLERLTRRLGPRARACLHLQALAILTPLT
jgi:2-polyprenyl-6-hydroxyphenyl methylase/3-demethylubiquinone-9 3-methyltransferase